MQDATLTERREAILDYIRARAAAGRPPTYRELVERFGTKSTPPITRTAAEIRKEIKRLQEELRALER